MKKVKAQTLSFRVRSLNATCPICNITNWIYQTDNPEIFDLSNNCEHLKTATKRSIIFEETVKESCVLCDKSFTKFKTSEAEVCPNCKNKRIKKS